MSFSSSVIYKKPAARPVIVVSSNYDLHETVRSEIDKYGWDADLNHINVSRVTDFSKIFENLEFTGDISKWDVSSGEVFTDMFANSAFNSNIGEWDMSRAVYLSGMFRGSSFNRDIGLWNTGNVRYMNDMFACSVFDRDISAWDIKNVVSMTGMFRCSSFTGDIGSWNPEYCDTEYMFNCSCVKPLWCENKEKRLTDEIKRMRGLKWPEGHYRGSSLENLKELEPGIYSVWLNRDTGMILTHNDGDESTVRLMKFTVSDNMSGGKWINLYDRIKETEKTCLQCIYKTSMFGLLPGNFISAMRPWRLAKNKHKGGPEFTSLYLVASVNWHAKKAGLPCIKKTGPRIWQSYKP